MVGSSDRRRQPRGSRPGGRSGPGRTPAPRAARTPPATPSATSVGDPTRRPRPTGRAAVLVLVLAVLVVSFASSMRAYLQQRSDLDALRSQIAEQTASIKTLSAAQDRFRDPAYAEQQARLEGYVMPGDKSYVVLGADGKPLQPQTELTKPSSVGATHSSPAWWASAWSSVQTAGDPPRQVTPNPLAKIDAPPK